MFKRNKSLVFGALFVALFALLLTACAPASVAPGSTAASVPGGITVVGRGEATGAPNQAQVQIGVETFAASVEEATSANEANVQSILAALIDMGVAEADIQTSNYSLWPEQRYGENGPEGIVGYRVNNQVNVTIRDINQVGEILAAAAEAGANSIFGVNFMVADPAGLEAEAREAAIADAQVRAASIAELSGVELGKVVSVSEVIGQPPIPYGAGGGMVREDAAASIAPGQLTHLVQLQVTFAIQ